MVLLVKLISILVILYGCLIVLRPDTLKKVLDYVKKDNTIYYASAGKLIAGVIMMIAAKYCSIPWIILFFGALSVFGGAMGFVLKKSFVLKMMDRIEGLLQKKMFIAGISVLVVGILIALAA
ncbi:MAG: hypothetical protein ISS33_05090 [Candidatus Omnitrophica bacterium]|nr:hypothetical protein [Candidatus Omnitrophota bacterium]